MNNLEEMILLINIINTDPSLCLYLSMTSPKYQMHLFIANKIWQDKVMQTK
jgi:hypothetical protein